MDDNLIRREATRPRRVSAAAELGANTSLQDGEVTEGYPARESQAAPDRAGATGGKMERRSSVPQLLHQRHMPKEPLKFHIPRKNKEKRALCQYVSTESREYEDMMNILTSSYIDTSSAGCFTYCKPRLVHSELLEKEFVEKRREMKADGRTEKELEESYCFLLTDTVKLPSLCEKGLWVGQSWITVLGNPSKGVYLSRYSDLLQINALTPGFTGEIIIFKVMKGKVKSIYENMKNLLDPTPRFDSHISKNASKVTSLTSYRAFELTQHYFYEYSFDELRQRPRQVCPYAVVSFQFKGKDSSLPSKPLAPIRMNSQSAEGSKERTRFTVWTGDLVKGDQVLFQISLHSFSPPFLPHRLPEKLEIGFLMRLNQLSKLLPSELFSYNLYNNNNQEVVKNGHCCSLLEVTDRSRSTTSVTRLLQELEIKRVVLVTPLTERGFLFLLSSVQMATPNERGEGWKRCLQALFVFPETRDVAKSKLTRTSSSHDASESLMPAGMAMPRLSQFIPALHHALVKARANPPPELSAGVERQAREYLSGQKEGKVRQYPMVKYDSTLDEGGKLFPAPKHHRVNMDGYLHSYLYSPALYLLSVARARHMVEAHCGLEEPLEVRLKKTCVDQKDVTGKETTSNTKDRQTHSQKTQQLIDLVLTCKRNAENEVNMEEGGLGVNAPGRKRRLEQETAERALKFLKASQETGKHGKVPVDGHQVAASPSSLTSVMSSLGLHDVDMREDGSELTGQLLSLLTGLKQAARGTANQSQCDGQEEEQRESCPFDSLATKLGLPTNCDIDLRKQEELEEQTAGSVSSLEGFSPSSHSGEMNHHGAASRGGGGGLVRRAGGYEEEEEEEEIPWVLIPITGLCSERYTQRDRNIPQDPRFHHLTTATSIATATKPPKMCPTPSPEPSPPHLPSQCPSPEPSPPPSPSQCPSPEPSPPISPSQCPSPEPSPPPSPSQCPSPQTSPPSPPSQCLSPNLSHPPSPSQHQSPEPYELSPLNKNSGGANEVHVAPRASRELAGVNKDRDEKLEGKEKKDEPSLSTSVQRPRPPAPERRVNPSPPPAERDKDVSEEKPGEVKEVHTGPFAEGRETHPAKRTQKRGQEEAMEDVQEEGVEMMHLVTSDKQHKGESRELVAGCLFSPSISALSSCSHRGIDTIVDKHLGDFSSDLELLLQEQSINYSHSAANKETSALQDTHGHAPISQFSQYVSLYNPCPPVDDYVSSLQDSIDDVLKECDSWPNHRPSSSGASADTALASRVNDFVASIRAANANTSRDDEGLCGGLTADVDPLVSETAAHSRRDDMWQPHTNFKRSPDPPPSHVTLSGATSATGSVHKPRNTAVLCPPPNKSPHSHWKLQQGHTLEMNRTASHNVRQSQDTSTSRTTHCTTGVDGRSSLSRTNCQLTHSGFTELSKPLTEASHPSESVPCPASLSNPAPGIEPPHQATALNSLISQLQPEVYNSLVEIIKDIKKNSLHFYLHNTEPGDQVYEDVKKHLLSLGNVEQSPVAFLSQENSDIKLLVIIRNKDIAGHIHKIPGLVSLKRHPSVVFVGIDTLDDIRNKSCDELFVSGGCIVSDESVLNPDFITHDQLAALLMVLEKHSLPESVWRWKIHCKTHMKLKEQSRFRRDAANLLDVLSIYQKRQMVEFLPYHHCDMMNHQSPDLDCLIELQRRYTRYRHTVLLSEHHFEKFTAYTSCGIIVSNVEEFLHNFSRLVGYHDIKDKQPIIDDMLAGKEHLQSLSSCDQPQHQAGSSLLPLSHLSDQLVPDTSCKEGVLHHSGPDFEVLRMAISQLRAERQAQQQQQQQQQQKQHAELSINPLKSFLSNPVPTGSHCTTPSLGRASPAESEHLTPGKRAVAATLDLIHSALQPELEDEERTEGAAVRQSRGGSREGQDTRRSNSDTSTLLSNQSTATVAGQSNQNDSTSDRRQKSGQQGELAFPQTTQQSATSSRAPACPVGGSRSRDTCSDKKQPVRGQGAPPGNGIVGTATGTKVMVTDGEDNLNPAVPRLQQNQQPQQLLQQLKEQKQLQQSPLHLQQPSHSQQQQQRARLLQTPHLPQFSGQPFSHGHMLGPLGGIRSLLGPTPLWPGSLRPASTAALVWGFQAASRDLTGSSLLGEYHNPSGQSSKGYRGGQRGGGFNGM